MGFVTIPTQFLIAAAAAEFGLRGKGFINSSVYPKEIGDASLSRAATLIKRSH